MSKHRVIFLIAVIATSCFAATISNPTRNATHKYGSNTLESLLEQHGGLRAVFEGRIVGGNPIEIELVPWIVSLRVFGSHRCGGSLITATRALTAAHCTAGLPASSLEIRAGSTSHGSGGYLRSISRIVNHPLFSSATLRNDISVLHFNTALDTSLPTIAAIRMPNQGHSADVGSLAKVSGWGATCEGCGGSSTLLYVLVPIISNYECNIAYDGSITDGMICAGFPEGNKDACQGDSGGPLSYSNLEGIVSWGAGCGRPNSPGVYTRVSHYRNWIDQNL